jgi:hypothetical protein
MILRGAAGLAIGMLLGFAYHLFMKAVGSQ